jgi:hypothetical protein
LRGLQLVKKYIGGCLELLEVSDCSCNSPWDYYIK